jgi:response regulator RpfG family c-di-GMP phosphodiesterase
MTRAAKRFLIVDDDPLNNSISRIVLRSSLGAVEVRDFVLPELALEYIENEFTAQQLEDKTTLLLDINMPNITGWEFLEKFETFTAPVRDHFNIYMLSSSVNPEDIQRAKQNPLVIDFIEKPLNKVLLKKIFMELPCL